jgi:biopolymer transport protein ExbD
MQRKRFDQINVIPLIDILLVLLVMVVTTATFVRQGILPVELPKAKDATKKKEQKEVTIYVTKDGKYHIEKEPISVEELAARIAKMPKDQTVVLRSDKDATFQNFVTVMDLLKKYHHEQLYIVTKE